MALRKIKNLLTNYFYTNNGDNMILELVYDMLQKMYSLIYKNYERNKML